MKSMQFSNDREAIIARSIREVVSELRLVDPADYIAFIRCELFANIADLVSSATELHFYPGTLSLGHGGDFVCDWYTAPTVTLDMEFRNKGVYAYFRLTLSGKSASVELNHIVFDTPDEDPARNTARLAAAIEDAKLATLTTAQLRSGT